MKTLFQIKEYGTIREGLSDAVHNTSELTINNNSFNSLANFIEDNQEQKDFNKAFAIGRRNGNRYIKVKNYVGVIETIDGLVIEILPKTFISKNGEEANVEKSKELLLTMLKSLKNSPFVNLNIAHLKERKNFPILEIFISSYLDELAILASKELRGDYVLTEDNTPFLKGKLLLKKHIKYNSAVQTKFYCEFDEFNKNIPPNKLLKTTLFKLKSITSSNKNKKKALKLLQNFDSVDISKSIDSDLFYCKTRKKSLDLYGCLIDWSEVFLKNKSFTSFHGKSINQAILFPMEKLFESYITQLLKKYCRGHIIDAQDKKYCLIGQKTTESDTLYSDKKFTLKPDIVFNKDEIILDTKWKVLNENSKKYDIKEGDIYQMHAYGRRYQSDATNNKAPRLGLIYPWNPNFENTILQMRYEGGKQSMLLDILSFDFDEEPEKEIKKIRDIFILA